MQTIRMIYMPTWHEHSFLTKFYLFYTNCTSWSFFNTWMLLFLQMLYLNINTHKLLDCRNRSFILFHFFKMLLFRNSSDHFKDTFFCIKSLVEILQKSFRWDSSKMFRHLDKLESMKEIVKPGHNAINSSSNSFYL